MAARRLTEHIVFDTSVVRHHVEGTHNGPMIDGLLPRSAGHRFHVATTTLYEIQDQLLRRELSFECWRAAAPFWEQLIDVAEPVLAYPGPPSAETPIDPVLHSCLVWRHLISAKTFEAFNTPYVARDSAGVVLGTISFSDDGRNNTDAERVIYNELVDKFVASCANDADTSQAALIKGALAHVRETRGEEAARRSDAFLRVIARIASMRMSKTSPYKLESHPNDFVDLAFLRYLARSDVTLCLEDRSMRAHMEQAQILDVDRVFNIAELIAAVDAGALAA